MCFSPCQPQAKLNAADCSALQCVLARITAGQITTSSHVTSLTLPKTFHFCSCLTEICLKDNVQTWSKLLLYFCLNSLPKFVQDSYEQAVGSLLWFHLILSALWARVALTVNSKILSCIFNNKTQELWKWLRTLQLSGQKAHGAKGWRCSFHHMSYYRQDSSSALHLFAQV